MKLFLSTFFFLATCLVKATPVTPAKECEDYEIPLTVTSANFIFAPRFANNYDVIDYFQDLTSRTAATDFHPFTGVENQTATYTISGTFCTPRDKSATHKKTVLIATHGINADRSYWNPGIQPEKYSFVDYAIGQGYSIFFYDRLGTAESSTINGYVNQCPIQVEILRSLSHLIRSGQYTGEVGVPDALVLVGHSLGSALSAAAIAAEPDLAEGLILTGWSYNGTNVPGFVNAGGFRIATEQSPGRWRQLDNGYLTLVDIYANVHTFFKKPDYDVKVVQYTDARKQPFAVTELSTLLAINLEPFNYKGVAMVISGQFDFIFCTSQCDDVIEHPAAEVFSNTKAFKAVSYPGAGHALNLALNATGAFGVITDFLGANGL